MGSVLTTVAALIAASAAAALIAPQAAAEILFGPVAPLVVAVGSWRLMERAYRRSPEQLARLMVRAFLGKLVFFGIYVIVAVGVLSLDPAWFVGSFAVSFIVLHLTEALQLRRLFAG